MFDFNSNFIEVCSQESNNSSRPSDAYMSQQNDHIVGSDTGLLSERHQRWHIVYWNRRNKLKWNTKRNSYISFEKNNLNPPSGEWRFFCLGLNVLNNNSALFEKMVWGRQVDNPVYEQMRASPLLLFCFTGPQQNNAHHLHFTCCNRIINIFHGSQHTHH